MVTLQQNKLVVSLLVVLSFGWSGWYLINWFVAWPGAREIFIQSVVCLAAAVSIGHEVYSRFTSWNQDRQTRPSRNSKS